MSKIVPLVERHRESGWWKPIRKALGNGFVRFEAEHITDLIYYIIYKLYISRLIRVLTLQG